MSNITSTGPAPLATNPPDPLTTASPAIGKDARGRPVAENPHPTTRARERQQLAQAINRNTFGFASRVVKVNSDGSSAQASTGRPRSTAIGSSSSSSTTSVGERQSKSPSANSQSNSSIGQTGNPTALQNKTEAQQKQLIDTSEKFLTAANKLNEMRAQYEDQSGISKYLPGNQNKTAMRAAQQELGQQIQNYQFSQDPQINGSIINLWLAAASDLSLQDQKVIYNQIQQKLLGSEYRQEILQTLNAQRDNPQIAALRDAYTGAYPIHAFENQLGEQLTKGSLQDFVQSFTAKSMDSKSSAQLLVERAAVEHLLNDPAYTAHKTTLQFLLHMYNAYLEADNPHKLTQHIEKMFTTVLQPVIDQVKNFSSLSLDIVKQQAEMIRNNLEAYNQMLNHFLGDRIGSVQKNAKTDTLNNQLRVTLTSLAGANIGQGLSQLFPTLQEVIKNPGDLNAQKELQQKLQGRVDGFSIHQTRLAHIAKTSNDAEKKSQIANLTAGFPNTLFPYEFQQHIDRVIAEGSINDSTTFGSLIPKMQEPEKAHQATVYRNAAREALKRDDISLQTRAALEKVELTNDLYLNLTNSTELERINRELFARPFDIETVHTLAEVCNFRNAVDMSSVFKLIDAYIQKYRDKFIQHFREFIQKPENIEFLKDHMVWDQTHKPANQPITQLQASLEVIRELLALGRLKDNKNLQAISEAYQKAIDAKQAKPDFT